MTKQHGDTRRQPQQGDTPSQTTVPATKQQQSGIVDVDEEKQLSWREYYERLRDMF